MPKLDPSGVTNLDEAIEASQAKLAQWLEEDKDDPGIAAAISLTMALNPGWCRWLKESGTKSHDIITALSKCAAQLICEVVANVSEEENHAALGKVMIGLVSAHVEYGLAKLDQAEPLPAFRRKDS